MVSLLIALTLSAYPLDNVRVVDADTIDADIQFPLGITLKNQRIRAVDFDAWEQSKARKFDHVPASDEEIRKGKQATKELIELLKSHRLECELPEGKHRGSFGRILGVLWLIDQQGQRRKLADWMEEHGHLRQ